MERSAPGHHGYPRALDLIHDMQHCQFPFDEVTAATPFAPNRQFYAPFYRSEGKVTS
jgi:hypothetical protein